MFFDPLLWLLHEVEPPLWHLHLLLAKGVHLRILIDLRRQVLVLHLVVPSKVPAPSERVENAHKIETDQKRGKGDQSSVFLLPFSSHLVASIDNLLVFFTSQSKYENGRTF